MLEWGRLYSGLAESTPQAIGFPGMSTQIIFFLRRSLLFITWLAYSLQAGVRPIFPGHRRSGACSVFTPYWCLCCFCGNWAQSLSRGLWIDRWAPSSTDSALFALVFAVHFIPQHLHMVLYTHYPWEIYWKLFSMSPRHAIPILFVSMAGFVVYIYNFFLLKVTS